MAKTEKPAAKKTAGKKHTKTKATPKTEPKKPEDKLFFFKGLDGKDYKLNLRQKLFVEFYLSLHGNAMEAVIEAGYNVYYERGGINKNLARSIGSENLTKPAIIAYVNLKLSEYGYDDENVKKQHLFLLNQFGDLSAKAKGIDMYYKIKGEYAAEKADKKTNEKLEGFLDKLSQMLP